MHELSATVFGAEGERGGGRVSGMTREAELGFRDFKVQGLGFKVQGLGFRVLGLCFEALAKHDGLSWRGGLWGLHVEGWWDGSCVSYM